MMDKRNETNERCVVDFSTIDKAFSFRLAKVNYTQARKPIQTHIHPDMIEIVYLIKGEQVYHVAQEDYVVKSGEVFMTFENEPHSTGSNPEDKADFFYFIIDLDKHKHDLIGYGNHEGNCIIDLLTNPKKRIFKGNSKLNDLLDQLIEVPFDDCIYKKTRIRNLVSQLLLTTLECKTKERDLPYRNTMKYVRAYIEEHIYQHITIAELAMISGLSETRFKTKFKKECGMPPHEYVLRQKIALAKTLLSTYPRQSITDIAYTLSFSSSQYFATVFKRFTTMSPKAFRTLNKG
ncbi:helix-turn-helix transcriptional regulator [Vallitalea pronyensis]|uniref:Helix-turn-helix transcriptional regulator n=1 Tax=Vallitalea pronyensis TaxID=1348613 RepID=A0A8J8SHE5_9FIRM|nr:AraC family transcriptional regulator [Vallitalea pronyensis]QUI23354.1 helix-turn-helix transcriptional regulator [Vallitalea pronyensis]